MSEPAIGIIGLAVRLPDTIRRNDDPIFDWIRTNHPDGQGLFTGYDTRRVLAEGETVMDILLPAAKMAIDDAGLVANDIDMVLGTVSPSTYILPSDLFALAHRLNMPETTLTIPLTNDFNNFTVGVLLADALVRGGRARNILVAVGGGWTRIMNYRTPQSISAADGAAAAVVGVARRDRQPRWSVVDAEVIAQEQNFGDMYLIGDARQTLPGPGIGSASDPDPTLADWTGPYYHVTDDGLKHFGTFGAGLAPKAAQRLLERQGIDPSDIAFTGHQASQKLLDAWKAALKPGQMIDTLAQYGNMTVANIPVNLWTMQSKAQKPYVVALGLAGDMHAHALLLRSWE
jgi:3-oxoacyl-[acyl-carrier-protein] synthase III